MFFCTHEVALSQADFLAKFLSLASREKIFFSFVPLWCVMTIALQTTLGSCSRRCFWDTDGYQKQAVFLFNLSSHYHIYITKYLFTSRDYTSLKIWERQLSWHAKCSLPVSLGTSKTLPAEAVYWALQLSRLLCRKNLQRNLKVMKSQWFDTYLLNTDICD